MHPLKLCSFLIFHVSIFSYLWSNEYTADASSTAQEKMLIQSSRRPAEWTSEKCFKLFLASFPKATQSKFLAPYRNFPHVRKYHALEVAFTAIVPATQKPPVLRNIRELLKILKTIFKSYVGTKGSKVCRLDRGMQQWHKDNITAKNKLANLSEDQKKSLAIYMFIEAIKLHASLKEQEYALNTYAILPHLGCAALPKNLVNIHQTLITKASGKELIMFIQNSLPCGHKIALLTTLYFLPHKEDCLKSDLKTDHKLITRLKKNYLDNPQQQSEIRRLTNAYSHEEKTYYDFR